MTIFNALLFGLVAMFIMANLALLGHGWIHPICQGAATNYGAATYHGTVFTRTWQTFINSLRLAEVKFVIPAYAGVQSL